MAAVWSKKATINKQLAEMMEWMMERERGWVEHMGGVLSLCAGWQIERCKKYINKICPGLRWPCYNISHLTINQKHAGAMERVYESRCNQRRVCRGDEIIILGGIRS
jgi:hypothetical protein